jgi:hydroxybutyrate-dimer hydrolase
MKPRATKNIVLSVLVAGALAPLPAAAQSDVINRIPPFITGDVQVTRYEGGSDDLLTAGLGQAGLASPVPPMVTDPGSAAQLRRLAIYNNYRALVDTTPGGGYGEFFGPAVDAPPQIAAAGGRIPGYEYLAYARSGRGGKVTLMVQIPDHFDPAQPCIVTAPSSGSRGIYGAIGTAGEWGLKKGCAVAYTDKGTGTGAHNLEANTVQLIDGRTVPLEVAGEAALFDADLTEPLRERFNARTPDRFAFKHAHSRNNPEQDWGRNVLQSIEFAFYLLNERYGERRDVGGREQVMRSLRPENTLVIASSVSNGGGASVLAAEQDRRGWIDGVAVSEPNVNPVYDPGFTIVQGSGEPLQRHSRPLYDYITLLSVYQGCANVAQPLAPLNLAPVPNACASLHAKGLLQSQTLEGQAREAQAIINDYGILPEQNILQPSHWFLHVPQAIAVTYANAYGRFSVARNTCGFSFGATAAAQGGAPVPLLPAAEAVLFATSNGIPPTGGVDLIYNDALQGPVNYTVAQSPTSGVADYSLDGFLCLRELWNDDGPGKASPFAAARVQRGVEQVRAQGDLQGKPAIFVTGRSDAILPPNHTSRAYFGLNRRVEGDAAGLRYYEILNAQHLDVLNGLPGFRERFIPLHVYFNRALDLMYEHLRDGTALPPSQVVRTVPRGQTVAGVPPLSAENVPPIDPQPPEADRIRFVDAQVRIPE